MYAYVKNLPVQVKVRLYRTIQPDPALKFTRTAKIDNRSSKRNWIPTVWTMENMC